MPDPEKTAGESGQDNFLLEEDAALNDQEKSIDSEQGGEESGLENESPEGGEESSKAGQSKNYYSTEDFQALLLKSPVHIDPERVPDNLKPAYDAAVAAYRRMQADYTKKMMAMKERPAERKPRDIYEAFAEDPQGVLTHLDAQISKLTKDGMMEEALELRDLKTNLIFRRQMEIENITRSTQRSGEVVSAVRREIPDFDARAPLLTEFAVKELGLTEEEISRLTDPAIMGETAAKVTIAINRLYNRINAGKRAEQKQVKTAPPILNRPGSSGLEAGKRGSAIRSLSDEQFEQLITQHKFGR
jgi:hypothetical protein